MWIWRNEDKPILIVGGDPPGGGGVGSAPGLGGAPVGNPGRGGRGKGKGQGGGSSPGNTAPTVTITSAETSDGAHYLLTGQASDDVLVTGLEYTLNGGAATPLVSQHRMTPLPGLGSGEYGWNGTAHIQDNVTTADGVQYVVWVDYDAVPRISKRTLPSGIWETFDLSSISGDPLGAMVNDSHNALTVAVDSDGYIHIVGNQHSNSLQYIRSDSPNDITAWTTPGMVGSDENSVTYPQWLYLPDDTLLFFYRDGVASLGDTFLNRYDPVTETWARVGKIIDGKSNSENPYPWHLTVSATGRIHMFFCWRDGDADYNEDLCYAYSDDGGDTWRKSDGTAYTLPITHATAEIVVNNTAPGTGMLNQCGADVDSLGRPHAATFLNDGSGDTQMHHVWFDGDTWHNDQVTAWTYTIDLSGGTFETEVARPSVFCHGERVFIAYRHNIEHPGEYRCVEVTPGIGSYADFLLFERETSAYELTYDTRALRERGELHALVCPLIKTPGSSMNTNETAWDDQPLDLLSIDLDEIDDYVNGLKVVA